MFREEAVKSRAGTKAAALVPAALVPAAQDMASSAPRTLSSWLRMHSGIVLLLSFFAAAVMFAPFVAPAQQRGRGSQLWNVEARPRSTIAMKERADDVSPAQRVNDISRGASWLEENGGFVGKIKVTLVAKGEQKIRGLVATAALAVNETILKVPRDLFLCSDCPALCDDACAASSYGTRLSASPPSDFLLAIRIWEEESKGEQSRWSTFVKELPGTDEFATFHPLMASDELLRPFKALPIVKMVHERRQRARNWFEANALWKHLTWEHFWLGYIRYISRSYGITVTSKQGRKKWLPVTVPVSDLGNTAAPDQVNTRWEYDAHRQEFVVTVTKPVAEGQELFESYQISSLKDNSKLAFMFGFTLPDNPTHVEQLGREACRDMLQIPQEAIGSNRISALLYSLAQEHCVASGETQNAQNRSKFAIG